MCQLTNLEREKNRDGAVPSPLPSSPEATGPILLRFQISIYLQTAKNCPNWVLPFHGGRYYSVFYVLKRQVSMCNDGQMGIIFGMTYVSD